MSEQLSDTEQQVTDRQQTAAAFVGTFLPVAYNAGKVADVTRGARGGDFEIGDPALRYGPIQTPQGDAFEGLSPL